MHCLANSRASALIVHSGIAVFFEAHSGVFGDAVFLAEHVRGDLVHADGVGGDVLLVPQCLP